MSLSGLRADSLAVAGAAKSPTPFLHSLGDRALLYEEAYAASPNTLPSHLSVMTGLLPQEHGVATLGQVLSPDVPVLAERFAEAGFRTAAFTDAGYVSARFGLDRGFDEFTARLDPLEPGPLTRAASFLRSVDREPFFLFVQSGGADPPYSEPPDDGAAGDSLDIARANAGFVELTPALTQSATAAYRQAIGTLDDELRRFLGELERLGLASRTVVVVTADHATELGEHGRLAHTQVYPESLRVPLLLFGAGIAPRRVSDLAQTTDIAATLARLAGLQGVARPSLPGLHSARGRGWAAALTAERQAQETLLLEEDGRLWQLVSTLLRGEHDGTWVTRHVTFDTAEPELVFQVVSFHVPRSISVTVDGVELARIETGVDWSAARLALGSESRRRRVTLAADDCVSPVEVGVPGDPRCLSFKLRGIRPSRLELFELKSDPLASQDLSFAQPDRLERMVAMLTEHRWQVASPPASIKPTAADLALLAARAELPEPPFQDW